MLRIKKVISEPYDGQVMCELFNNDNTTYQAEIPVSMVNLYLELENLRKYPQSISEPDKFVEKMSKLVEEYGQCRYNEGFQMCEYSYNI
jgi:hypothetical protein